MILDYITLENNIDYAVVDTLVVDNNKYLFLVNENNEKDIVVRKVIKKADKEFVTKLDTNEEFESLMNEFLNKHKKENNDEK